MPKFTINLPDSINVVRGSGRGADKITAHVEVPVAKLPVEMIARLVEHGIIQKVGDAAAGKTSRDEIRDAMTAVVESLVAGNWGRSRGIASTDPLARFLREAVRARLSAASAAEYKALASQSERNAYLDAKFEAASEEAQALLREVAEASAAEEAAKRKRLAKLDVTI
jgi:hypothetical protein